MKIRGEAELFYVYPDGRKEPATGIECNDICWPLVRLHMLYSGQSAIPTKRDATSQATASTLHWRLFYGSKDIKATPLNAWYNHDGIVDADQDTPTWTPGATAIDPDLVTITALVPAPVGSARTIRVLGITWGDGTTSTTDNAFSRHSGKMTILRLSSPCVQEVAVQLLITYRLYFYPTEASPVTNVSNVIYEDFRKLVKLACEAVASTHIGHRSLIGSMAVTSYDLDDLTTMSLRTIDFNTANSTHELTDSGIISNDGNTGLSIFTNIYSFSKSYTETANPSMGTFVRNVYVGEAGINNNASTPIMNKAIHYHSPLGSSVNPLQGLYLQRGTPVGPFQDISVPAMGTMTGVITYDTANYVDPGYPVNTRVRIVTGGNMATPATYQVDVMKFKGGFVGNRWLPRTALLPQTLTGVDYFRKTAADEPVYEAYMEYGGTTYRSPDKDRLVAVGNCQRNTSGITVYDVVSGSKRNFNSLSTPALPVTAVADIECAKGYIYVACANTGLWRINPAMDTVEQVVSPTGTDKAYQISVKNDAANTLWVLFDGGVCKLANPDAALGALTWTVHNPTLGSPTFTYAGITDANWDKVTSMVINPDNAGDDQFLFICSVLAGGITTGSFRLGFVWWSTGTGVAANPSTAGVAYQSFVWNQTNLLRISDSAICVGNQWLIPLSNSVSVSQSIARCTYGANSLNTNTFYANAAGRVISAVINGTPAFITTLASTTHYPGAVVLDSSVGSIVNNSTLDVNNAATEFMLRQGASTYDGALNTTNLAAGNLSRVLCYLPSGNWLLTYEQSAMVYGVTPLMLQPGHAKYAIYKSLWWKTYGWDGAAWVLGNPGAKPVHAGLEEIPGTSGIRVSFANGAGGTSFITDEFWSRVIGVGLMKDNGANYSFTYSYTPDPTQRITLTGTVPQTPLGALVDEPVTFVPYTPDATNSLANITNTIQFRCIQNKGLVVTHPMGNTSSNGLLISDQLIPASTDFDFRFKWISFEGGGTTSSTFKAIGIATGTGPYTFSLNFQYVATTGQVQLYNNTTAVGTAISNPDFAKEFKIERVGTTVTAYYDGVVVGSVTQAAALVVMTRGSDNVNETGWYDLKMSYTENRRVMRVGDSLTFTGSFATNFSGLTSTSLTGDQKVFLGSGSPIEAILDFTSAGVALTGTGRVKVAAGAGWLIFHNSETALDVTGYVNAHYNLTLQP